jgi:hypothetical protein
MLRNTTPPRKTANDIVDSSLRGVTVTAEYQDLIQEKAKTQLKEAQNHHRKLQEESPYTKNHAVGEIHNHVTPKRYFMDQMPEYAKQGYTILFVEHLLYEEHQQDLDAFNASGTMSPALSEYLNRQNEGHMDDNDNGTHNYTGVLKAAQTHGIRVVALDTRLSYSFRCGKSRALAFSLTATEIINREAGTNKWLAFMGNGHNHIQHFTDGTSVPGIANLLPNTVTVNVFDKSMNTDSEPLSAQRNAERTIIGTTVYADIGITADSSIPLNIDLSQIPSPKTSAQRSRNSFFGDTSPSPQSLNQVGDDVKGIEPEAHTPEPVTSRSLFQMTGY